MIFQKYFGKKLDDKVLSYDQALAKIAELEKKNAKPIEIMVKQTKQPPHKPNLDFNSIYSELQQFLAPYQYEFNPELKGNTTVRYRTWNFVSYEQHRFDFTQIIDNLWAKNLKNTIGRVVLVCQKTEK